MFKILADALGVSLGQEIMLKPKYGHAPYPCVYRFLEDDMQFRPGGRLVGISFWASVNSNSMQMRIFFNLLRGNVEVFDYKQL